jgi:23S rRNA pseudouridine2605 synthase
MEERLHKILANAGYGSRRACEQLIDDGHVSLNGEIAQLGCKATLDKDDIRIDGRRLKVEPKVYFLVNKPPGYLCTNSDPAGRHRVRDLLVGVSERVYPVGRLDADSRGLVIMTNDGDLAARMTHPKFEVPKTYEVEVSGRVTSEDIEKLTRGVWLSEGRTCRTRVRMLHRGHARSQLEITLREGRNRQVRRILARLGHKVRRLTRVRLGPLNLRGLGPGRFRALTRAEVAGLLRAGAEEHKKPKPKKIVKRNVSAPEERSSAKGGTRAKPKARAKTGAGARESAKSKTRTATKGSVKKTRTATKGSVKKTRTATKGSVKKTRTATKGSVKNVHAKKARTSAKGPAKKTNVVKKAHVKKATKKTTKAPARRIRDFTA